MRYENRREVVFGRKEGTPKRVVDGMGTGSNGEGGIRKSIRCMYMKVL